MTTLTYHAPRTREEAVALLAEGFAFEVTTRSVASLAYLAIGNSLISITLLLAMIRRGEASRVSALLFLVPPGADATATRTALQAPTPAPLSVRRLSRFVQGFL